MAGTEAATETAEAEGISIAVAAIPIVPVPPEMRCADVYARFRAEPDTVALPVVQGDKPIGLVHRYDLTMSLAQDYGRALYAQKPITAQMDAQPLIVEHDLAIDELEWMIAVNQPAALTRGFIVTRNGSYMGVGNALTLLQLGMKRSERRNRQIEEARASAEAANRAKSEFLAVVSHELRTPLNAIIGFSDLIRNEVFGPIGQPRYAEYLKDIHTSGQGLLGLINDILDTAKIENGKMELFEETVDVEDQVAVALRIVTPRADSAGIRLRTEIAPQLPALYADGRLIRQILLNLLSNAIKFAPKGEVTVAVREDASGTLALAVRDTGIGMSAAEIEIALSPFGQIAHVHTRRHDGSGLGLPLVKSMAALHGATLEIGSQPGSGTTVTVVFPAKRVLPKAAHYGEDSGAVGGQAA